MTIWESLVGMVAVEMTSGNVERELGTITQNNIPLDNLIYKDELTALFSLLRPDYLLLADICRSSGAELKIIGYRGIYWTYRSLLRRKTLAAGLLLLTLIFLLLPTRVLYVKAEGNMRIPSRQIIDAAEACGIRFGASRMEVRSEKMKNTLLSAIPDLRWAGVNTYGCTAVISVKEKEPESESIAESSGVCSIIARQDGVVRSISVIKGSATVNPGQAVLKGQTLISGYTDCGISIRAERAEGEILANTDRSITMFSPSVYVYRLREAAVKHRWSILIGKKRINLWFSSGIWNRVCGKMYREYWLTLPGGFRLPAALVVEEYRFPETEMGSLSPQEAERLLRSRMQDYLKSLLCAGCVKDADESISHNELGYLLTGRYSCEEMIGCVRWEQNGENNGETD